jgi:hypothetical protein
LKKLIVVLFLLLPLITYSQLFKSYGLQFSSSFENTGWSHPDTVSKYYHDKAYIANYNFGVYGEFLAKKYISTLVNVDLRFRFLHFEYDLGNVADAQMVHNAITYADFSVCEKLKYDKDPWSVYLFGGIKSDIEIHRNIEKDFQNVFNDSKKLLFGVTTGVGFAKRFFKFWRLSFDIYYNHDLTKMYQSGLGKVQLDEFGFKLGIGPYNPATK